MDPIGGSGSDGRLRFGGLATGLDTGALIETLLQIERRPLDRLELRRQEFSDQQSLLRDLNTRVLALRDAARTLDNRTSTLGTASATEELLAYTVNSGDASVLTGTATGEANPGTYSVQVNALASVGRRISAAFASDTTKEITGGETLEIDYGGAANIVVNVAAGGASLRELRDAINADPDNDGGVQAEVLFDGTQYRLVISGTQTGADNDISVVTEPAHSGGGPFVETTIAAANAQLQIFGIDIERASNNADDIIPGVTLELRSADPGTEISVEVALDKDSVAAEVEGLVDAYNAVIDFVERNSAFDEETFTRGLLAGDATVSLIVQRLQSSVGAAYSFVNNNLRSAAEIGISFGRDGRLTLDREKLDTALDTSPQDVRELLSGGNTASFGGTPIVYPSGHPNEGEPVPGDGLATALARALEPITRIGDGFLPLRVGNLDARISEIDDRILRFQDLLERREELLVQRFSSLEQLVSGFQAQQSFLLGFAG